MRIFLVGVFLLLFAIISLPLYLVAWLLGKKDERLQVAFSQKIVNNCTKYLTFCTTQVIITTQVVFFIEGLLFGKNRRFYDGFSFYTGL